MTAPEPDFAKVDDAARLLCSHDQGQEIAPEVWANDTPEVERQEYRREAYRYALVAAVMDTPRTPPAPLPSPPPSKVFFVQPLPLAILNRGYIVCRTCLWSPRPSTSKPKAQKLIDAHRQECPGEIPETRTEKDALRARTILYGL